MRGNFSRFQRTLDKLENISTSNIRNLINRGDELAVNTEGDDFNSRFLMERAGATGQQDDDMLDHHSDVEDPMSVQ
jgi:hypothetical protein